MKFLGWVFSFLSTCTAFATVVDVPCAARVVNPQTVHIRERWIAASRFAPTSNRAVLDLVVEQVRRTENAVVLLDLDGTVFSTGARAHAALREWLRVRRTTLPARIHDQLAAIPSYKWYSWYDCFTALGFTDDDIAAQGALIDLGKFALPLYRSNAYVAHDTIYKGAPEFAQRVYAAGAKIVYLTGRITGTMRAQTEVNLERDGFPVDPQRTKLITKDDPNMSDNGFKEIAVELVRPMGNLVASADNEPVNVVSFIKAFPKAMHIFVNTNYSEKPAPAVEGVYQIDRWK